MSHASETLPLPGAHLSLEKMPGHWLLAHMGKRVLRPGGLELTRQMLDGLHITAEDAVVELAPGLGATARLAFERGPAAYVGVERDAAAAARLSASFDDPRHRCLQGTAAATGLPSSSATVVYAEAMLTMQTPAQKEQIVAEAFRLLESGGRYGIHELGLWPDDLDSASKDEVLRDVSGAIHVGARPLTLGEWRALLQDAGFHVEMEATAPMHLLELGRMLRDEGALRTLLIAGNLLTHPAARARVREMRRVFKKHSELLCAVSLVARKP